MRPGVLAPQRSRGVRNSISHQVQLRIQVSPTASAATTLNYYGRTVAVHNLLKGRKCNQNKAVEGFDKEQLSQRLVASVFLTLKAILITRCRWSEEAANP